MIFINKGRFQTFLTFINENDRRASEICIEIIKHTAMNFINELRRRNPVFFWYGALNFAGAAVCIFLIQTTEIRVNNINAFIKPLKFYLSIAIFCWTMGWLLHYLQRPSKVRAYNIMAVIVFTFEIFVITWQAANGRLSHFNNDTVLYAWLFRLMGMAIVFLTFWTGYIGILFFKKKDWTLPMPLVWGIRLGILCFVFFALEGGVMAALLRHTVGGDDGGKGLPLINWNKEHGDLRIAHFLGMHSLQIFPLFGYYIATSSKTTITFAAFYVGLVVAVLVQALMGLPLF